MWLCYSLLLKFYFLFLVPYIVKPGNELCTGTEIIDTVKECKLAINNLAHTYNGLWPTKKFPKGCFGYYTYEGRYIGSYLNTHSTGKKTSRGRPICKIGE